MGKIVLPALVILFISAQVFAGANGGGYTAPATPTPPTSSTNEASNKASSGQDKAESMNMISAGLMTAAAAAACSAQDYGQCAMFAAMAVMNMSQAGADGGASGFNSGISNVTDWGNDGTGGTGLDDGSGGSTTSWGNSGTSNYGKPGQLGSILGTLKDNNWKVDPKNGSLTSPKGKKISSKDFTSASALAAAGVPKGLADSVMSTAGKIEKEALSKANLKGGAGEGGEDAFGEGGGGGGGTKVVVTDEGYGGADGLGGGGLGGAGAGLGGMGGDRNPTSVAGMTKKFNGELIGVSGDSIFDMMNRRYKKKSDDGAFYDVSASPRTK